MELTEDTLIGISLSIFLSISVGYSLSVFAEFIPESNPGEWVFASATSIIISIVIISWLMKKEIKDRIDVFKILLITSFSLVMFSLGRFFKFRASQITDNNFILTLIFLGFFGFITALIGYYEKDEKNKLQIFIGGILIGLAILLYYLVLHASKIGGLGS